MDWETHPFQETTTDANSGRDSTAVHWVMG